MANRLAVDSPEQLDRLLQEVLSQCPDLASTPDARVRDFGIPVGTAGVYFIIHYGHVAYVGSTSNLLGRFGNHQQIEEGDFVYYIPVPPEKRYTIESELIRCLNPKKNSKQNAKCSPRTNWLMNWVLPNGRSIPGKGWVEYRQPFDSLEKRSAGEDPTSPRQAALGRLRTLPRDRGLSRGDLGFVFGVHGYDLRVVLKRLSFPQPEKGTKIWEGKWRWETIDKYLRSLITKGQRQIEKAG